MGAYHLYSRRRMLAQLAGLSAGSAAFAQGGPHRGPFKRRASWVPGPSYGEKSYFNFGLSNGAPQTWVAHNCNQPYACKLSADGGIMRMELRVHDHWEAQRKPTVERTMVQAVTAIGSSRSEALPLATDVWRAFSFLVEPGPAISGVGPGYDWLIFADIHSDYAASHATAIPIQFELDLGDVFIIRTHGTNFHMQPTDDGGLAYRAPASIDRGVWHDLVMRVNMDPVNATGRGGADVYLDGRQVLAYAGPLGFENDLPYHQFQIYRPDPGTAMSGNETVAIRFANSESLTSGSLASRTTEPFHFPCLPASVGNG